MRIAVWYNLPSGGGKRALYDHIVGLKALGHHIEAWRPPVEQQEYLDFGKLITEHEVPFDEFERDSAFYPQKIYLAAKRAQRLTRAMEKHSIACAEQIAAGGFDLLFANTDVWFHTPFIARYVNLPRALYLGEPNRPLYEALPRLPWLLPEPSDHLSAIKRLRARGRNYVESRNARVLATEECENAKHYNRILVNSRYSRESVLRVYGVDATVCYLGIDAALFQFRRLIREPFVMSVGSMTPAKNPQLVIRALARIPKAERPRLVWVFNFIGSQEFYAETLALASELEVEFDPKQFVSDDELVSLLNRATAFVYTPRLEPFGLAPLEANACGAPVVAVAEAGVRETVEHNVNGLLVESNPQSIADGIQKLFQLPELARRLGEAGERGVHEKWSIRAGIERLEKQLTEVLEGQK
jgi:glycosyltransferase involved in cell wall biosynthesis